MKKVLLLTGPGGVGKTTVSELLAQRAGWVRLDADQADSEFFPNGGQWLPENTENLAIAHDKIIREASKLYGTGSNVVVDYIIFGRYLEFIKKLKKEFKDYLEVKVLFPSREETVKRDLERECWTTGEKRIMEVMAEFEKIKAHIGQENYIDTTGQTPEGTFEKYFKN